MPPRRRGSSAGRRETRGDLPPPSWRAECATRERRSPRPAAEWREGDSIGAVAERIEEPAIRTGILAAPGLRPDLGAASQAPRLRLRERDWFGARVRWS